MKNLTKKFGFSLVELLVVISIIATLTAILLPNFMGARERARDAQKIQDIGSIKNALRLYYNDNRQYPVGSNLTSFVGTGMTNYMTIGNVGYTFAYTQTNGGDGFWLCVNLESGFGDDDTSSQVKCGAMTTGVCGLGVGITADRYYAVCAN